MLYSSIDYQTYSLSFIFKNLVYSILNEKASIIFANTSCHQKALYLCELLNALNIYFLKHDDRINPQSNHIIQIH
jgi:hypothetical protein